MIRDFSVPFNWLRAALPWRLSPSAPAVLPDDLCPLLHPDQPLPSWVA